MSSTAGHVPRKPGAKHNEVIYMELWTALLTGGVGAAIVAALGKIVDATLQWRRQRKARDEDEDAAKEAAEAAAREAQYQEMLKTVEGLKIAQQASMFDRIKYLATCYIRDRVVDFDDRRNLKKMHTAYHNYLGGNGDLDLLMEDVERLPLKETQRGGDGHA